MPCDRVEYKTTAGVLSVGDPVLSVCRCALQNQIAAPPFKTEIVSGVSPFSAAFDELVRRCSTQYLIQVDEDMVLFPYAIARMQEVMEAAPENIGMVLFYLYDPDRDQRIHGIKIFRTTVLRSLRSKDVKSSEMDLLEQMLDAGYRWVIHPETMGYHGLLYSPESIYRRYKSMYEKDILTWNVVTTDMRRKAEAFAASGDPNELFALLGAAHGIAGAQTFDDKEKDFHSYDTAYLRIFRQLLLTTNPQAAAYDARRPPVVFRNEPIAFEKLNWKSDCAGISATDMARSRQDAMKPEEAVAFDIRVVECTPRELLTHTAKDSGDPFLQLWLGVSHWYYRDFSEAWSCLERARSLGAPVWRVSWYELLCLRDDRKTWNAEKRQSCVNLVHSVLERHPDFTFAETFRQYLEGGASRAGAELLVEDFFHCNPHASAAGTGTNLLEVSVDSNGCLALPAGHPLLLVVHEAGNFRGSLGGFMRSKGYVLWHADEHAAYYRSFNALPAPLFWTLKSALPLRYRKHEQPPTTIVATALEEISLKRVQEYLVSGKTREAHSLMQQIVQASPGNSELREVERRISALVQNTE